MSSGDKPHVGIFGVTLQSHVHQQYGAPLEGATDMRVDREALPERRANREQPTDYKDFYLKTKAIIGP